MIRPAGQVQESKSHVPVELRKTRRVGRRVASVCGGHGPCPRPRFVHQSLSFVLPDPCTFKLWRASALFQVQGFLEGTFKHPAFQAKLRRRARSPHRQANSRRSASSLTLLRRRNTKSKERHTTSLPWWTVRGNGKVTFNVLNWIDNLPKDIDEGYFTFCFWYARGLRKTVFGFSDYKGKQREIVEGAIEGEYEWYHA